MQRAVGVALAVLVSACGHDAAAPVASSRSEAKPEAKPAAVKRPRVDRPPLRLGGEVTWASAEGVTGMRFCPGDRELVAVDAAGRLRRYRVEDDAQLAVTVTGAAEPTGHGAAAIE